MSQRYKAVVALLDDPVNFACVVREMNRRTRDKISPNMVCPPVPKGNGCVYPTLREALRFGLPEKYEANDQSDSVAEIFWDTEDFFVLIRGMEEEIGPFDSLANAKKETERILELNDYTLLPKVPWDEEDLEAFPSR